MAELRPALTGEFHVLPFERLAPDSFERLCLRLVELEGFENAENLGAAGSEQGRDIVAWRGDELWAFQCKRVQSFGLADAKKEIDKVKGLPDEERPVGYIFLVTRNVRADIRDGARRYWGDQKTCRFWALAELDAKVKRHPRLVDEFFRATLTAEQASRAAAAALTSLHQLQSPLADFTGREAAVSQLLEKIEQGGVAIAGVRGMGGVGKTELALKVADGLTAQYSDAQFFIDLKGTSAAPLAPQEVMGRVVRAFHPRLELPQGEGELVGLYRSVLHGKRALLLLDNATGRAQVAPLVPPRSCLLLVTSRRRFALPGLYPLNLDAMESEEAQRLLLTIAPRINGYAVQIAGLCGRLPLALRLAGRALAEQEDLNPAAYVERLKDKQTRLDLVDASLSLSYDLLEQGLQVLWRLLVVFPGTFDRLAAAAVWDSEPEQSRECLSALLRYSLVEWDKETDRYGLHDLVRLFVDGGLDRQERAVANLRFSRHYVDVLRAAGELYDRGGEEMAPGLALLDLEWANIQAGQRWASTRVGQDVEASELCCAYAAEGNNIRQIRRHPQEIKQWVVTALPITREMGDRLGEADCIQALGDVHHYLADFGEAREWYAEALLIYGEIGNRQGEGKTILRLGDVHLRLAEYGEARERYTEALAIHREIGARLGEANCVRALGEVHLRLAENRQARECYAEALPIFRETGALVGEANCIKGLGDVLVRLAEYGEARDRYEQALPIYHEIGSRLGEAICIKALGDVHRVLAEYGAARERYAEALVIYRQIGSRLGEASCIKGLGDVHRVLADYGAAREHYEAARTIYRHIGSRLGEANCIQALGDVHFFLSEYGAARERYDQALPIYQEISSRLGEAICIKGLGDVHVRLAEHGAARKCYEQARNICIRIGELMGEADCVKALGDVHLGLAEHELAWDCYEEALKVFREIGARREEAECIKGLGDTAKGRANLGEARDLYKSALELFREIGSPSAEEVRADLEKLGDG